MKYQAYTSMGAEITLGSRRALREAARIYLLHRLRDALRLSFGKYVDATVSHADRIETDNGFLSACGALVNAARKRKVR